MEVKDKLILIAEDIQWNFRYLETVLETFNEAKVLWARNGVEAVKMCEETPEIDLVIMDIQMPVMDGLTATKEIRKFRPLLPIIAHTAYAMPEEKEQFLHAGCSGYLAKPVRVDELLGMIKSVEDSGH